MESYIRIGGRGMKNLKYSYMGWGVKTCQNHPYVINKWSLKVDNNPLNSKTKVQRQGNNIFHAIHVFTVSRCLCRELYNFPFPSKRNIFLICVKFDSKEIKCAQHACQHREKHFTVTAELKCDENQVARPDVSALELGLLSGSCIIAERKKNNCTDSS